METPNVFDRPEANIMNLVRGSTNIPVPRIHRLISSEEVDYRHCLFVMDCIKGKLLSRVWNQLSLWKKLLGGDHSAPLCAGIATNKTTKRILTIDSNRLDEIRRTNPNNDSIVSLHTIAYAEVTVDPEGILLSDLWEALHDEAEDSTP
ncbi:hypothetical protein D9758_014240 [Tetrapyrgos nigripes]|uniref:Uncharacterized protein n=1 Tax=Tetrapyrgos nigripes TaxID=182062 RepID=A0A8H5CBF5_9AGAR|nr:hypothetical protein D9758_014240 [Tetrapyrgos nigripes]